MKCHQCDRPAIWRHGDNGPWLCLSCSEKVQHMLNMQWLQHAAISNQALDDMDAMIPIGPRSGRIPVQAIARAMQKTSTLNNFTLSNSNVGSINTGDLNKIDAYVSMTAGSDAEAIGEQLRLLVQAVLDSHELDVAAREEIIELLQSLSQQLAGDRKKSVMMSLLRSVEERAKGANAIVQLAGSVGAAIAALFGS